MIIGAISLFGFLKSQAINNFTDVALRFTGMKLFFVTLFTVTLPIIFKNIITWIFEAIHTAAAPVLDSGGAFGSMVYEFTGVAGYLALHMQVATCFAIILTALTIRLVLNFVPFVGG